MKLYLRIILHIMLVFLVLISLNFYTYLKHYSYHEEYLLVYIWELIITIIYIIHVSISINKANEVKKDFIILRFNWLSKRHLGLRKIIGFLLQPIIWTGLISFAYLNIDNYDLFSSYSYQYTFLDRFQENLEAFEFIFPLSLSLAYVLIFLFELITQLYFWLADGFKK